MGNLKILFVFSVKCLLVSYWCFAASEFSFRSTMVKLHEAATLPCYQKCTGLVTWVNQYDGVALCDQTSCQSTEGFQMSHDQYLKGNLSLTITEADFSKRMWYTCRCNGEDICAVSLRIDPFSFPVSVQAGQSLSLDLPVPDNVEVTLNRTDDGGSNTFRLCRIEGHQAQCNPLYKQRVSVGSSLQLKEVKNQDGGVYILWDIKNDEAIGMYTVTVTETRPESSDSHCVKETSSGEVVLGVLLAIAFLMIVVLFVENHRLRKRLQQQEKQTQIRMTELQKRVEQESERQVEVQRQPEVPVHTPVRETIDDRLVIIEQMKLEVDAENEENASRDELGPLIGIMESPAHPASVTDGPPLSLPVPDSCSTNTRVFE